MPPEPHDFAVFRHDRATGETRLVSVAADGGAADGRSQFATVSADGRVVAFHSTATNLVDSPPVGVPGGLREHVYVRDMDSGVTELVSVSPDGQQGSAGSTRPAVSADGRYVAFHSRAANLTAGPPAVGGPQWQVFVRDRQTGVTEVVSVDRDGDPVDGRFPSISADGRYVAFRTDDHRIMVRDLERGVTEQVTVDSAGRQGAGQGSYPSISADGRYVAFASRQSDIAAGVNTGVWEVIVHDRATGATEVASVATDGTQSDGDSQNPAVSGDGRLVAFDSLAAALAGDPGGARQILARDRGGPLGTVGPVAVDRDADTVTVSGQATFSGAVVSTATRDPDPLTGLRAAADTALHAAQVAYRPERADLFVRVQLDALREPLAGQTGPAGRVYGLAFTAGGQRYEIRVAGHAPDDVRLYRCEGLTRHAIAELADLRAYVAPGDTDTPGPPIDQLTLPDAQLPQRTVTVLLEADDATIDASGILDAGTFTATLDTTTLPPEPHTIRIVVCLGNACTATTAGPAS